MAIVQTTDFTGQYKIPKTCYTELSTYFAKYEKQYLVRLLGAELYDLFIADLTAGPGQVPQTQRFIDLFDPFQTDEDHCVICSEGIKKMLIQFIYFEYMRESRYGQTVSGAVQVKSSVADVLPFKGWNLERSYNEGVGNYHAIQWYICDNDDVYPEENTQRIEYIAHL